MLKGVEKERYPAIYGAKYFFKEGEEVEVGDKILEWDPFAIPILTEVAGTVKFEDFVVGQTLLSKLMLLLVLLTKLLSESKDPSLQPRITCC